MPYLFALLVVLHCLVTPGEVQAYYGTTTFDSVLVAHTGQTICPPTSWLPDSSYVACCSNGIWSDTLTTGLGPGSKTLYACCHSGYTCTGAVSLMKDWSIDSNGDLQTIDLANPPTPTAAPASTTAQVAATSTPPITSYSTGTISQPGATPITTSAGVIIYVYGSSNNQSVNVSGGDSSLSGGAIAGITIACTVVTAICAVLGIRYARKTFYQKQAKIDAGSAQASKAPETVSNGSGVGSGRVEPVGYGQGFYRPELAGTNGQYQGQYQV